MNAAPIVLTVFRRFPVLPAAVPALLLVGALLLGPAPLAWAAGCSFATQSGFGATYEGTQTCLDCHGEGKRWGDAAGELMQTVHWSWQHTDAVSGQNLGKRTVINNYCIAVGSNEPRCTSCHAGFGWRDDSFDFSDPTRVDCLVCHDTTGTYMKTPTGAGLPDPKVNLDYVARHVGPTSRATCGACHFYGGGGDAVKHGDLDSTLTNPTRQLDVHMGIDGGKRNCSFCHSAGLHRVKGTRYSKPAPDNWLCEECHTAAPHQDPESGARLNAHTARVACQSCHVPYYARGGRATKMTWDWSTAGEKNPDGTDKVIKDAQGDPIYDTKKGTFTWASNVVPEYVWFNGQVRYTTLEETIDPTGVITFNQLQGDINDSRARIVPVKRFTGKQPYDAGNNTLAVPHLFPSGPTDTAAYWKGYNWTNAIQAGMAAIGQPFSGNIGWIETDMFWIQNHMVAPKENALACADCHTPRGRLDFRALGYPDERVLALESLAGFEIQLQLAAAPSGVMLKWTGTPGHRYQVQYSTAPGDAGSWVNAPDGLRRCESAPAEMTWEQPPLSRPEPRFYRVMRLAE